ncbi:MAG: hypothetical protein AB7O44_23980 [Hyphomicrobiaceae bacterium]
MKVAELRTILEEVKAIYEASGSDKPAKDFAEFIELLGGHEHQTVDEFLAALSALPSTASGKGTSGDKLPDAELVASFIERLTSAGTDQAQFDAVYVELGAEKRVRAEEMNAIAHGYIKGREKWPSRAAGYQAIKKKFVERADRKSREGIINKVRRWG